MSVNSYSVIRCVQTPTKINWHKWNSVGKRKHTECPWGEAGCASSRCVPAKWLKIVLVGCSSKPVGTYWHRKNANKWNIIKPKHVRNGENVIVCGKPNSLCCEAGDVVSKLCAGQTTKNGSMDCSAELLGAHSHEKIAKKWNIKTKRVRTYCNSKIKDELAKNAVLLKLKQNCLR